MRQSLLAHPPQWHVVAGSRSNTSAGRLLNHWSLPLEQAELARACADELRDLTLARGTSALTRQRHRGMNGCVARLRIVARAWVAIAGIPVGIACSAGRFGDDQGGHAAIGGSSGGASEQGSEPMGDDDAGVDEDDATGPTPAPPQPDLPSDTDGPDVPDGSMHGMPAADVPEFWALLDELEGWGTGTNGGINGTIFVVDTLDDDGPRSLRAALESEAVHWIVFEDGLDGVIELSSTIQPKSDKTVDARGRSIQLRTIAGDSFTALKIIEQSNLAFVNLTVDDEIDAWDQDSEGADGMTIVNSHHIWVHHCTFARWLDGAIDIRYDPALSGGLSHDISVTWSEFSRVYQALNWTVDRISFGHNRCDRVRRRCIKVITGRGHSYNNVIGDWTDASIQVTKDGGELYSHRNMFVPGGVAAVNVRDSGGKIKLSNNRKFGDVQFVGGSDAIDETFMNDSKMLARIDVCSDTDQACWDDLRALVQSEAGAH